LWNKDLRIQPILPKSNAEIWLSNASIRNDKVYFMLSMILFLLKKVNPKTTFQARILLLLAKYPNCDKKAMGFPKYWFDEPLWIDLLEE
jgi:abortive infection bacteriophage resistance protein